MEQVRANENQNKYVTVTSSLCIALLTPGKKPAKVGAALALPESSFWENGLKAVMVQRRTGSGSKDESPLSLTDNTFFGEGL
ncbi:hypothetical protein TcBrA4_0043380 [Trypanosoma cruzi]|nr:hypothetical protein TcBrA4_0043380 [Trypanosoma cruzi]